MTTQIEATRLPKELWLELKKRGFTADCAGDWPLRAKVETMDDSFIAVKLSGILLEVRTFNRTEDVFEEYRCASVRECLGRVDELIACHGVRPAAISL